jgi:hypothetical protein
LPPRKAAILAEASAKKHSPLGANTDAGVMRVGPIITILCGLIAVVIGIIGVSRVKVPSHANTSWTAIGERLRENAGNTVNQIDPAYEAQQRRFAWGATAALGFMAMALGVNAARTKRAERSKL